MSKIDELKLCIKHINELIMIVKTDKDKNTLTNILAISEEMLIRLEADPYLKKISPQAIESLDQAILMTEQIYGKHALN